MDSTPDTMIQNTELRDITAHLSINYIFYKSLYPLSDKIQPAEQA